MPESRAAPSEDDIPKAVLARITKGLPEGVLVATETKNALGYAAKMFILYLTASSNDVCHGEGKSRIGIEHVFKAIDELELPFGAKLKECFESYKLEQSDKKARKSVKADEAPKTDSSTKDEEVDIGEDIAEEEDDKQENEEEEEEEEQNE